MNGVRRTMHDEREEWSREGRMDVEYDNNRLPFHASVVVSYLPESYLNEQMIVKVMFVFEPFSVLTDQGVPSIWTNQKNHHFQGQGLCCFW